MYQTPSFTVAPVGVPSKAYLPKKTTVQPSLPLCPSSETPCQTKPSDDLDCPASTLPLWRKYMVVFASSWMILSAFISSTALFAAIPEISNTFSVSPSLVSTTNSIIFVSMALSTFIWGPLTHIIGRRTAFNIGIVILILCSVGSAVAPNFETLVIMRVLAGLESTLFNIAGQTMIADIFIPTQRGTAVGFFMAGTVISPALGPLLGGVIVTYSSWRNIFWLQTAMSTFGLVLSLIFIPSITIASSAPRAPILSIESLRLFNPMPTFKVFLYPNVLLVNFACGFLAWTQYSILVAPRHLPIFAESTNALASSLFYLAPGAGFLMGTLLGGHWADQTVKKYITIRGFRLPQDRLNSGLAGCFAIVPISLLIFGWTMQNRVGGVPLAAVTIFITGFGLMASFNSLNTYSGEVLPLQRSQVMGGKYFLQYIFAGMGSALAVPLIEGPGIGSASTICAALALLAGSFIVIVVRWGLDMQMWWIKSRVQKF